jgi:hypothetical protein
MVVGTIMYYVMSDDVQYGEGKGVHGDRCRLLLERAVYYCKYGTINTAVRAQSRRREYVEGRGARRRESGQQEIPTESPAFYTTLQYSTGGLPFRNSFDFILTPTPHSMLTISRKLLISRVYKTQHAS